MCEMALNGLSLSAGSAAVLHARMVSADLLREGESPCFVSAAVLSAAVAHVRAHELDLYEGNALCALFFCQPTKRGHFQTCCTGRVSEDILKDVNGTFICYADSLYTVCVLQLMPKMLPRAA